MYMFLKDKKDGLSQSRPMIITLFLLITSLGMITNTYARPTLQTVSEEERDVTVSLSMEEMFILDDQRVFCSLSVVVVGDNKPLTAGDTIRVKLLEDDWSIFGFGDDVPWEIEEVVTSEEADNQRFEKTYDCSIEAFGDFIGGLEMYAAVEIDKEECGGLCELNPLDGEDNASTPRINMAQIDDDMAEDDDSSDNAFLGINVTDRVAKDADWFEVTYMNSVEFQASLSSNLAGGMIDMTLFDNMGGIVAQATPDENNSNVRFMDLRPLLAGTYYLQVIPQNDEDFNFYDLSIMGSALQTDCAPSETEERPCGLCGVEIKRCSDEGSWGQWSMCEEQGVCEPGSVEIRSCGENGSQEKVCNNECQWGVFGNCIQCVDGESGACYSGPSDTRGVGVCIEGRRTCTGNTWSSCQGDGRPVLENCNDGEDNDCDGAVDRDDTDCIADLGDACTQTIECASDLICLGSPFPSGYCGQEGCTSCTTGVCANALGAQWCLKPCNTLFECRSGYLCAAVGPEGQNACVPPCMSDTDCGAGEMCKEQICVTSDGTVPTNPMGSMPTSGTEAMNSSPVSPTSDEGCEHTQTNTRYTFLFMLLGLAIYRRKMSVRL